MTTVTVGAFTPSRTSDRTFFLLLLTMVWAGIFAGFVPDVLGHFQGKHAPWAWVVHLHAAAYVGWLTLLTAQMSLIRGGRPDMHRRLGLVSLGLIPAMMILGPATAIVMDNREFGTPDGDPPFLILQLASVATFATVAIAGLLLRKDQAAHRRLMLIATLVLSDAGFARWLGGPIAKALGQGPVSFFVGSYVCSSLLLIAMGVYDLATRRRLHPAYFAAALFVWVMEVMTTAVYVSPAWKPIATHLIGH